jgi:hypothetical protein
MPKGKTYSEDKIKKLEELIAKKKAELLKEKGLLSEKERKSRTRQLIQLGGLIEIAGLREDDKGFILGCLLRAAQIETNSSKYNELKLIGDHALAERQKLPKLDEKVAVNG